MECSLEDVNEICNEEKTVPQEWICKDGSDVTEDFINYARPLIQGAVDIPYGEDGLPDFVISQIASRIKYLQIYTIENSAGLFSVIQKKCASTFPL
mgnify:CR=1 FL=1